jgi:hypothetical protein
MVMAIFLAVVDRLNGFAGEDVGDQPSTGGLKKS